MIQQRGRTLLSVLGVLTTSACIGPSAPTWQPNTTGSASGDEVYRRAVPLAGSSAASAQAELLEVVGMTFPDSATNIEVEQVEMVWGPDFAPMANDDVTVLRADLPGEDVPAFQEASLCSVTPYMSWYPLDEYVDSDWVMDLIDHTPDPGDLACLRPVPGISAGPKHSAVIVVSDSDPAHVIIANYDGTPR